MTTLHAAGKCRSSKDGAGPDGICVAVDYVAG